MTWLVAGYSCHSGAEFLSGGRAEAGAPEVPGNFSRLINAFCAATNGRFLRGHRCGHVFISYYVICTYVIFSIMAKLQGGHRVLIMDGPSRRGRTLCAGTDRVHPGSEVFLDGFQARLPGHWWTSPR